MITLLIGKVPNGKSGLASFNLKLWIILNKIIMALVAFISTLEHTQMKRTMALSVELSLIHSVYSPIMELKILHAGITSVIHHSVYFF